MESDHQLVKLAQGGDRSAISTLYRQSQPRIYRYIAYRVGDTAVADDLTAEVFISMVKHINQYEHRGRPVVSSDPFAD